MTKSDLLAHLYSAHADTLPTPKASMKALAARHRALHAEGAGLTDEQRAAAHQHVHADS